jgi:hypothetical protein
MLSHAKSKAIGHINTKGKEKAANSAIKKMLLFRLKVVFLFIFT